jgi:hypothetical protein
MQHDRMIEAFTPNGSNQSLGKRGADRTSPMPIFSQLFSEIMAKNGITVAQQVARRRSAGKGLPHLLSRLLCDWVGDNMEVQNAPPVMGQHQKHVKNLDVDRRHVKKSMELLRMIFKEGLVLRGHFVSADHLLTLLSAMWKPSSSSSPWMRRAPQKDSPGTSGLGLRTKQLVVRVGRAAPSKYGTGERRRDAKPNQMPHR